MYINQVGIYIFCLGKKARLQECNCSALLKRKRCNLSRTGFSILKFMKTKMIAIWKKREQKMTFWFGSPLYLSFRLINAYAIKYVHLNLLVHLFEVVVSYFFFVLQCNIPVFLILVQKSHRQAAPNFGNFGAKIQSSLRNIAL